MKARKVSRQRLWQIKKIAQGGCLVCGQPRVTASMCARHAADRLKREARKRLAAGATVTTHVCGTCGGAGHNARTCGPYRSVSR